MDLAKIWNCIGTAADKAATGLAAALRNLKYLD
jgi:hypothetical protein